eukprot:104851-Pelagomonas_calceolata.AAC.11
MDDQEAQHQDMCAPNNNNVPRCKDDLLLVLVEKLQSIQKTMRAFEPECIRTSSWRCTFHLYAGLLVSWGN